MRASTQDLIHAHGLATMAPSDLGELYVSAAIATIKPSVNFLDFHEFAKQKHMVLRVNKTIQELGLDLPGFVWNECCEMMGTYGHAHSFYRGNYNISCYVYCKDVDLRACRFFVDPEWEELLSLLDDDEYLVFDAAILSVVKLPP